MVKNLAAGLRKAYRPAAGWRTVAILIFLLSPVPVFVLSMMLGNFHLSFADTIGVITSKLMGTGGYPDIYYSVIFDIRLPRVLCAMMVGASLSVSGAAFQGIFRNPLVDPYILGLSSGAAFGAALSIAVLPWLSIQVAAFAFSLLAIGFAYLMARTGGQTPVVSLVLSGVITSSIFTALLSIVQMMAHEKSLQSIVLWIMGSFNATAWSYVYDSWYLIAGGCAVMILLRWRLNVLAMGDEEARAVGMNVELYKGIFIVCASLVAAVAVSIAGIIALVGLIVPHMLRMIFGPDHRLLIPLSAAFGATYLLLVDDVARAAFGFEIPASIITTLVGAPFFLYLLRKTKVSGWE
ncbi:MAG: Cobalamin import system permease protein BtuC [Methanocella sp. PtaU1.Bin125]|nr:MAG: Cobalamin import system permease protein BtuC [Methanocella sp. PtaU1.Bin125]